MTLGEAGPPQAQASNYSDAISDVTGPTAPEIGVAFMSPQAPSKSAVPLPTGFSLFGAAILMLGLVGLFSGAQRVPALEAAHLWNAEHGLGNAEAAPTAWFQVEVHNGREHQVRHTVSARGAIDLIAELLNEGWEVARIRDRKGQTIDYEDVVHAWMDERPNG